MDVFRVVGRGRWALLLAVVASGWLLAACEPPPPDVSLVVNTTVDGSDAAPGDGLCEMTAGVGDCSLRAAFDEAAVSDAETTVSLPAGTFVLSDGLEGDDGGGDLDVSVARRVMVEAAAPGAVVDASAVGGGFEVHRGLLGLARVAVVGAGGDGIAVHAGGALSAAQTSVTGSAGHGLVVDAAAAAVVSQSTVSSNAGAGIVVDGTVIATYATVTHNGAGGFAGSVAPTVGQSVVGGQGGGADCLVGVVSEGGNLDSDGSCGLTGAGDVTADPGLGALVGPSAASPLPFHVAAVGSPVVDAVAPGASCGGPFAPADQRGIVRPAGAGCDRGAIEGSPLGLVVDDGGDTVDAHPGDGVCADEAGGCTLRAAVGEANAWPGADAVSFAATVTTVSLTRGGVDEDANDQGDLDITGDLQIDATGVTLAAADLPATYRWDPRQSCTIFGCRPFYVELTNHALDSALSVLGVSVEVTGLRFGELQPRDAAVDVVGGSLDLADVHLDGVHADVAGVRVQGAVTIADSSISNRLLEGRCIKEGSVGGTVICGEIGGRGWNGAGIEMAGGSLAVERSTVSGHLFGLEVAGGSFDIRSSSLLANTDDLDPISGLYEGPQVVMWALRQSGGNGTVVASTLEGARAVDQSLGSVQFVASTIDGLDGRAVGRVKNLTVAATFVADCSPGPLTSLGYNADEDGSCIGSQPTDRPGASAQLAPLADDGGPTLTRMPSASSALVDAIPPATPSLCDATLTADQRGLPRPTGAGCDIGAVERSLADP